jgi:hypothetical protein
MKKKSSIFGFLSVGTGIMGVIGYYVSRYAHSGAGTYGEIISLAIGEVGALVFASVSLIQKERYVFLPACVLILGLGLLVFRALG